MPLYISPELAALTRLRINLAASCYLTPGPDIWAQDKENTMFAVIQTGGKQYKVAKDDIIIVEKLDAETGKSVSFKDVLACGEGAKVKIGEPLVKGAEVKGEVLEQRKRDKVLVFKKKRRQTYRRKRGHRQNETVVKITSIKA